MSDIPKPWKTDGTQREGGQAWVSKVTRSGDDSAYALKRLKNPQRAARFHREIEILKQLEVEQLAGFPRVIDSGTTPKGRPYFVMPWFDRSLQDLVETGAMVGRLEDGLDLLARLAGLLHRVHSTGWAHRDLKPSNVMLTTDSEPVLCDFGLGLADAESATRLTDDVEAIGSRFFIAPENEGGVNDEVDQRPADFYAFAKIAWCLLLGRPPLARETQLRHGHRFEDHVDGHAARTLDDLCAQLLALDPRVRLADWPTVESELRAAASGSLRPDPSPGSTERVLSAAEAYRRSEAAHAAKADRVKRQRRTEQIRELTEVVYEHATPWPSELESARESLRPEFQLTIGKSSRPNVGGFITQLRAKSPELCPPKPDEFTARGGCALHAGIQAIGGQQLPSAYIKCFVVSSGEDVWFLAAPVLIAQSRSVRLIPALTSKLGRLEGPHRLGLATSREAADRLGASCVQSFGGLIEAYLRAAATGENMMNFSAWRDDE